jgi:hypothetical protein
VAQTIATLMGNIEVQAMPSPPPVKDGQLATGVAVLVMLGNDKAGKSLDEMGAATTTTAAGATPGSTTAGSSTGSSTAP